jgi:lysozyme
MLKRHEGVRKSLYKDSRGYWTIGMGFLVDPKLKAGLSDEEIDAIARIRIQKVIDRLDADLPWWRKMSTNRQAVLADMAYNLGVGGLEKFKDTLKHMQEGNYNQAALDMSHSLWAEQVKGRATELAEIMRNG